MRITLKAARVNAGLTQKQAAKLIGISEGILCKWERGYCYPSMKRIPKILEVYKIKFDDLLFFT